MKKLTVLLAALVLMACVVVSCGSSSSGGDEPSPTPAVTAKYLTEDEFAKSAWKGEFNGKELTLDVSGKTSMTLKYWVEKPKVSKNVEDPEYEQKTVSITYTFDAAKGVASGSGKVDGADQAYTATLTSKTAMKFTNGANGDVNLTKK